MTTKMKLIIADFFLYSITGENQFSVLIIQYLLFELKKHFASRCCHFGTGTGTPSRAMAKAGSKDSKL